MCTLNLDTKLEEAEKDTQDLHSLTENSRDQWPLTANKFFVCNSGHVQLNASRAICNCYRSMCTLLKNQMNSYYKGIFHKMY